MKHLLIVTLTLMTVQLTAQKSIHEFSFETLTGDTVSFSQFKGKKILVVNTASECGFTKHYEGLQELHKKYGDKLAVVGFPANNYGKQEPGTNDEIANFCKKNYGVTFTMAAKISVDGDDIHEIFDWLCKQENPDFTGRIKWNFEKFILNEDGVLINRFRTKTNPTSSEIVKIVN
jgi:glutathione peroxidase